MAEQTQLPKRQRDEVEEAFVEDDYEGPKRQKTFNQILSILEEDGDEFNQDMSDIFTTLQQMLSSDSSNNNYGDDPLPCGAASEPELDHHDYCEGSSSTATSDCSPSPKEEDEEDDERVKVMRHLLEASDDELGLPNRIDSGDDDDEINGGDLPFYLNDGLWEFEDEAANYYALLQAELFM